jgi:hypothetical protein
MRIKSLNDIASVSKYLQRIGAEPRSLRTAVVKELKGKYWEDIAIISIENNGKILALDSYAPTEKERIEIEAECQTVQWPHVQPLKTLVDLPDEVRNAPPENVFEFRDIHGNIVMLQVRIDLPAGGEKRYHPWTYWDDGQWRKAEPEGPLPLWGMEQFQEGSYTTVFIHEGAKAARAVRNMIEGKTPEMRNKRQSHPWGEEMSNAAHVGWIGGALSPSRTDWSALKRAGIKRAYIVSDNDLPGVQAVQSISFQLRVPTFHLQFTSEWPQSFDLADDFPKTMFKKMEGHDYYIGPSFRSCLHPATWATDQIPNPKGKPTTALRSNFKDMWAYVEEADLFVCKEMPEIIRSEQIMNKMLAPFSHSNETSKLIVKAYVGRSAKLCYRPDIKGKVVTDNTTSAINLHTPTHIKSRPGSSEPFLEFMRYMFPNPNEMHEVLRWCATIVARPDTRMEYGLLLVSERQGVGKTTLGSSILAPLVGMQNVGYPTENQIVQSEFNGWMANKRLIVIHEIYSGHSWKAYNRLKSAITDKEIEVNEKYQRPYLIENWCHIFACSNSMRALKVEEDDRRWYYPEVTEEKWPRQKFEEFHNWLKGGGLSIIKNWAEQFGDYVVKGQPAPMTERKKELIASSRTEGQQEAAVLSEALLRHPEPAVLAMKDVVEWVRSSVQGRVHDTDLELRKAMKEVGARWFEEKFLISGRQQMAAMNEAALEEVKKIYPLRVIKNNVSIARTNDDPELIKEKRADLLLTLRKMLKKPSDIVQPSM